LGNEPYTIVGVVGRDFAFDPVADIWLPFQFPPVSKDQNHYSGGRNAQAWRHGGAGQGSIDGSGTAV
jgi:hypothetical protein